MQAQKKSALVLFRNITTKIGCHLSAANNQIEGLRNLSFFKKHFSRFNFTHLFNNLELLSLLIISFILVTLMCDFGADIVRRN